MTLHYHRIPWWIRTYRDGIHVFYGTTPEECTVAGWVTLEAHDRWLQRRMSQALVRHHLSIKWLLRRHWSHEEVAEVRLFLNQRHNEPVYSLRDERKYRDRG